ncbi:hypothetical protein BDW69DRAFT_177877 [Aspergillus filifer]
MTSILTSRPRLTGALSILALGSIAFYITKKQLDKVCPRISISQLPACSASRILLDSGDQTSEKPWGADKSVLLSIWRSGEEDSRKTRWMPSFVALQVDIPFAQLKQYYQLDREEGNVQVIKDAYPLVENLTRAFLHGRGKGPEGFFFDQDVPSFSCTPGTHLFGRREFGAFMLGSWSSGNRMPFIPPDLPSAAPIPPSEFPSNKDAIATAAETEGADATGMLIYWTFPRSLVNTVNRAAARGLPWRLMDGGFQEFIVERISDQMARVTYVTLECSDLYPHSASMGIGDSKGDFKKVTWLFYELHVLYAQILLWRTLRQLR